MLGPAHHDPVPRPAGRVPAAELHHDLQRPAVLLLRGAQVCKELHGRVRLLLRGQGAPPPLRQRLGSSQHDALGPDAGLHGHRGADVVGSDDAEEVQAQRDKGHAPRKRGALRRPWRPACGWQVVVAAAVRPLVFRHLGGGASLAHGIPLRELVPAAAHLRSSVQRKHLLVQHLLVPVDLPVPAAQRPVALRRLLTVGADRLQPQGRLRGLRDSLGGTALQVFV
mmetsp:Transcript_17699/g.48140  ORF Transcript_17699/g.48140 Transcript_17699/m.48140 type:complete len:224 (+) Transcript_17699:551-1222(+)